MSGKLKMIITYAVCMLLIPLIIYFGINYMSSTGNIPTFSNEQITFVTNIIVYTILPISAIIILHKQMASDMKAVPKYLKWIIPAIILLYGTSILSSILISYLEGSPTTANQSVIYSFLQNNSFVFTFILASIAGPIAEESTFRYSFLSGTDGGFRVLMLFVSSVLFGLVHQLSGFSIGSLIAYSLLGFVFGCYFIRTNNLIFNILTHMGYNALALILMTALNNYIPG